MDADSVPVTRLMTSDVLTATPETALAQAADTLLTEGIGSLVIVDGDDRPVGMLTSTDLARFVSGGESSDEKTVSEYMTEDFVTIETGNSIQDAAAKMILNDVHHLPVVGDEGEILGIVSTMDLTSFLSYRSSNDLV